MWVFIVLYSPEGWSKNVNGFLYEYVGLVLQTAQVHNITIPGGRRYRVPSGNIAIDDTVNAVYPNRTSYSQLAISGADNSNDSNTTMKDIFDVIVENTRDVTPTCELPIIRLDPLVTLIRLQLSRDCLVIGVRIRNI